MVRDDPCIEAMLFIIEDGLIEFGPVHVET